MVDKRHPESLFDTIRHKPLADEMRPKSLKEVVGQEHLMGPNAPIGRLLSGEHIMSSILWGPPGSGKTTIARLIANYTNYEFESLSAVFSGLTDLRKKFDGARKSASQGKRTVLFVDEIHRFNKIQQDAFLPVVEDGIVVLIGATTENPSFELNDALLSRCQVITLNRLNDSSLESILSRAEKFKGKNLLLSPEARSLLKVMSDGDGRYLLNVVEVIFSIPSKEQIHPDELIKIIEGRAPLYDKSHDSHYNLISALHKSLRGSDVDAGLYWLARMLVGGEDPRFIARRLVRFSVEDVGLADPNALSHTISAWSAYDRLGSPEGELALAQSVIYLATAPKSNAAYIAYGEAIQAAKEYGSQMPPKHILNAPTDLMREQGYGQGYEYDHNNKYGFSGQNYFPENMTRKNFYHPVARGYEKDIQKRLELWDELRTERSNNKNKE